MNIFKTDLFQYLEGDMLQGKTQTMTIKGFGFELVASERGEENKCVLSFNETDKSMILNKTNAKELAKLFGPETDEWVGKRVQLYTERVKAFGKVHNALRLREQVQNTVTKRAKETSEARDETESHGSDTDPELIMKELGL